MSQRDSESKVIDGTKYVVYMLPPRKARKILVRIFQVMAPSAGEAVSRADDNVSNALGDILKNLADRLDDNDLEWMMGVLAEVTTVETGPNQAPYLSKFFDAQFKGKIGAMMKWFVFALGAQYGDFFEGSASDLSDQLAGLKEALGFGSQNTSTG